MFSTLLDLLTRWHTYLWERKRSLLREHAGTLGRVGDVVHPRLDVACPALDIAAGLAGREADRVGQDGGQQGGLAPGQARRRLVEVVLRRRFRAIDAGPPFDDVEIDLENPSLTPHQLDEHGDRK